MTLSEIEKNLIEMFIFFNKEEFLYSLLSAYGLPKSSITRLKKGSLNLSCASDTVIWKKKIHFHHVADEKDLHTVILEIVANNIKNDERFAIVTDYKTLLATDTRTKQNLDIAIEDLPKYANFFLPLIGIEKSVLQNEAIADRKAAEKMAKLFDEIKKDNKITTVEEIHAMNIFLTRLLFCYFAEDTGIFTDTQFTNALKGRTQENGSDTQEFLSLLFEVLNTEKEDRSQDLPENISAFPYVNGGLFEKTFPIPVFTAHSRKVLLESGTLDWSAINPDIFGSMFQGVVSIEQRSNLGQHYTSVPNIMKVLEPLFLNDLKTELEKAKGDKKKLKALYDRLKSIKIFDPACGSGNFLVIAYKELCRLQMKIIEELETFEKSFSLLGYQNPIAIKLSNFYGIELDDFPVEIARLSLYLAEHQIHSEFEEIFGRKIPTLPLANSGNIIKANACRIDWSDVCPKNNNDEIYVLGNPPFLGKSNQNKLQKEDMKITFKDVRYYRNFDYVTCWYKKASDYIQKSKIQVAFVSTNSICQGEVVYPLWSYLFAKDIWINFAYTTFQWKNSARDNAGVYCIIIGFACFEKQEKHIFTDSKAITVKYINAYLINASNTMVVSRRKPLSNLPTMLDGSKPVGRDLILSEKDKNKYIEEEPLGKNFIYPYVGVKEFIDGKKRYCLWFKDVDLKELETFPHIMTRIDKVKNYRLKSRKKSTQLKADTPHLFIENRFKDLPFLMVPYTTSEAREYVPYDFLSQNNIISNTCGAIYNAEPWLFSVITSKLHMVWLDTIGGKLEGRYRYSSTVVYNTFPFPNLSMQQKETLTGYALDILAEREKYSGKTLAQLYNPNKMPDSLREAHHQNDLAVERCYRITPFKNDQERLEYLFKQYEKMIEAENR